MLPRGLRLPRPGFAALTRAKRHSSEHFTLSAAPALPKAGGAAVIISKKVVPRSVDRHLLKRRVLAVIRPFARPDAALVVYAKKGSMALPFSLVKAELSALLSAL